jgi:hypothetical protein
MRYAYPFQMEPQPEGGFTLTNPLISFSPDLA